MISPFANASSSAPACLVCVCLGLSFWFCLGLCLFGFDMFWFERFVSSFCLEFGDRDGKVEVEGLGFEGQG